MQIDWKDQLAALQTNTEPRQDTMPEEQLTPHAPPVSSPQTLHILLDKKGRKGKVATIIEGFTLTDEEVEGVASELKRTLGTGGSVRGGEILLQGDWRERAAEFLRARGYRVK